MIVYGWIVLSMSLVVAAVLSWRLGQVGSAVGDAPAEKPTGGDAGPPEPAVVVARPSLESVMRQVVPLGSEVACARRVLGRMLGPDCPDLTVAYWVSDRFSHIRFTSHHQSFLTVEGTLEALLAALEARLFEEAPAHDVPARSRLLTAWTFLHLPARGHDLAIQSFFAGHLLEHHYFLLDGEGRLTRIQLDNQTATELVLGPGWAAYRRAMTEMQDAGPSVELWRRYRELTAMPGTRGHAHGWLAHISAVVDEHPGALARHLAFAHEMAPGNPVALLARAGQDNAGMAAVCRQLISRVREEVDEPALAGFLMAGAVLALHHPAVSRALCEALADQGLDHPGTAALMRFINERQRGAQA